MRIWMKSKSEARVSLDRGKSIMRWISRIAGTYRTRGDGTAPLPDPSGRAARAFPSFVPAQGDGEAQGL
jgi:hypothetical protein